MRVFVTRRIPEAGVAVLRAAGAEVELGAEDDAELEPARLRAGVAGCDVVLSLLTERIDRALLSAGGERLRGVANMAVGYDNVDVAAATELGIPVSNTPGVLTESTADLTWALLLAVARRIPEAHAYTVAGRFARWGPNLLIGADVGPGAAGERRVLGIVGYGRIGRAVARRARGFDMEVLACTRDPAAVDDGFARHAELGDLLARSDFVTLHVPGGAATRGLIGAAELAAMKPTAFLINTARGTVVDERALVAALRARAIAGAGLDVYEHEPELAPGLAELPNVVLLPHIASASRSTRDRMAVLAAEGAVAHARGERAAHAVDAAVYDSTRYRARLGR